LGFNQKAEGRGCVALTKLSASEGGKSRAALGGAGLRGAPAKRYHMSSRVEGKSLVAVRSDVPTAFPIKGILCKR
jgi:hypothetical protein